MANSKSIDHQTPTRLVEAGVESIRCAHGAAAYDEWLRGRVEASRNDPRPSIANDDMKSELATRRETVLDEFMDAVLLDIEGWEGQE